MRVVAICYFLSVIFTLINIYSSAAVLILLCVSLLCRICGCGSGESGCSSCGCCKACARELDGQEARQRGIFDAVKEMIPLDLLLGTEVSSNHIRYSSIAIKSYLFPVCEPFSCQMLNHTVCMQ